MKKSKITPAKAENMVNCFSRVTKRTDLGTQLRYRPGFPEAFREALKEKTGNDNFFRVLEAIAGGRIQMSNEATLHTNPSGSLSWMSDEERLVVDDYIDAYNELANRLDMESIRLLDVLIDKHAKSLASLAVGEVMEQELTGEQDMTIAKTNNRVLVLEAALRFIKAMIEKAKGEQLHEAVKDILDRINNLVE